MNNTIAYKSHAVHRCAAIEAEAISVIPTPRAEAADVALPAHPLETIAAACQPSAGSPGALEQYREFVALRRDRLHRVDRILSTALSVQPGAVPDATLGTYCAAVRDLREALQHFERFLLDRWASDDSRRK